MENRKLIIGSLLMDMHFGVVNVFGSQGTGGVHYAMAMINGIITHCIDGDDEDTAFEGLLEQVYEEFMLFDSIRKAETENSLRNYGHVG
jgi:hypothetical protein